MKRIGLVIALALASVAGVARADVGLDEKVYGATIDKGISEVELRYGRLTGGTADGQDAGVIELSHAFSERLYGGALFALDRDPTGPRRLKAIGGEAIVTLGHIRAIDLDAALYVEYEAGRGSPDNLETKLLLQHRKGSFDGRFNLIIEKPLAAGRPVAYAYGTSADWKLVGDLRGGVEAFGDLGTTRHFLPRAEHYVGPIVKTEIEHLPFRGELEIEAGYLFAAGAARDETRGQARLLLEYEFRF